MAKKTLDINRVFNHRKSISLVDTAEDLVDSMDNISVLLRHIDEKYDKESKGSKTDPSDKSCSLYKKLKENLEIARDLTDTLKREKWRLSRREMSVELRMGELEDYKSHLKADMTDMNQTVEVLSMRIVQLENALCDAQEQQENSDAEKEELNKRISQLQTHIDEMETKQSDLQKEINTLRLVRTDSVLRKQYNEVTDKMDVLMLENQSLKGIIRSMDEDAEKNSTADTVDEASEDTNSIDSAVDVTTQDESEHKNLQGKLLTAIYVQESSKVVFV